VQTLRSVRTNERHDLYFVEQMFEEAWTWREPEIDLSDDENEGVKRFYPETPGHYYRRRTRRVGGNGNTG
jgi:hypothetical protein